MRLIDVDAIPVNEMNYPVWVCLKKQPTIDAVPVVRCGECKHCDPETYHCDHPMGTMFPFSRKPDDFCSYGERKDGAE